MFFTKHERELMAQQTDEQFRHLVLTEVKRRMDNGPHSNCPLNLRALGNMLKNDDFEECVQTIISETLYWDWPS